MKGWFRPPTPRERLHDLENRIAIATTNYHEALRREEARFAAIIEPLMDEREQLLRLPAMLEETRDDVP